MDKRIDLDNDYLQRHTKFIGAQFSHILIQSITEEAKNNPMLERIGYKHTHALFGHAYDDQLNKIAEQKDFLDNQLAETNLKEVRLMYWPDQGPRNKIIWSR